MRKRKSIVWLAAVVMLCSAVVSNAARKDELTLLMIPREEETLRLGMDVVNRFETMLVSYRLGANNTVSLHGWTGAEWVNITLENFLEGDFFRKGPDSALIVKEAGKAMPEKMIPPANWCDSATIITTTELRPLLHLVGRYYDFSYDDWKWFARRYSMDMDAINPDQLNVAWYHRRMSEHLTPKTHDGTSDLQYWVSIRRPAPIVEPAVPVETTEQAEDAPLTNDVPASVPEETTEPAEEKNPLTNDVPTAVIMGAADADQELSAKPAEAEEDAEETAEAGKEPAEESGEME